MINVMNYMRPLGLIAIFISAFTWGLELGNFVATCPFCQVQRTMIGLLGILMVLPNYRYVTLFLAVVFTIFGTNISSEHIFNHVKVHAFFGIFMILATSALCIMVGQVLMLITRAIESK